MYIKVLSSVLLVCASGIQEHPVLLKDGILT